MKKKKKKKKNIGQGPRVSCTLYSASQADSDVSWDFSLYNDMHYIKVLDYISKVFGKMFCQLNQTTNVTILIFIPVKNTVTMSMICKDWYLCRCAGDRVWSRAGDWKPFFHGQGGICGNALERGHHFELHACLWRWSLSLCGQQPTWDWRPWHRRAQPHCFRYKIYCIIIVIRITI